MNNSTIQAAMLETIVNTTASAVIAVDSFGVIIHAYITKRPKHKLQYLHGRDFWRIIWLLFGSERTSTLHDSFNLCKDRRKPIDIPRFHHCNVSGLSEYLSWHFYYVKDQDITLICIQNVTESVLIDEEFSCITDQHEAVNRELCIAMSNLDFQLMDLEQARRKLAALYRITSIVQRTVNEYEVLEEILNGITRELGFTNAAILLLDEGLQELTIKAHRGYPEGVRVPLGKGITGYAALHRELVYVPDVSTDKRYIPGAAKGVSEVAVPLIVDDRVIGVLDVETSQEKVLLTYDLDMLRSLASHVAMSIDHATHVCRVEVQAITDGMTGLYNYRYFRTILDREVKRAIRYNRPLTLLMIDIDYFKRYNDTNGHRRGDEVLKSVAGIIKQSCRDVDFVVRYGGEEFAVLFPETSVSEVYLIAERIRKAISEYHFINRESQPGGCLTVSLGIASFPNHAMTVEELIDHADAALYQAKRTTKNIVCIFQQSNQKATS